MNTRRKMATRVARRLRSRGLHLAMLAAGLLALQASDCSKEDFYNPFGGLSLTGRITGLVTLDGDAALGATVTARQGGTVVGTDMADLDGAYRIVLDPGTYQVSTTITGADCPGEQSAIVVTGEVTEVNFACTTPAPQTGTVTGTVTVNTNPESGVAVTLREGTTVIATTTTDASGTYSFTNVATGTKNVSIVNPEEATCPGPLDVTVTAGGTATADFPCTRPSGDFTVGLNNPPPGWLHDMPGISSLECKVIQTTPAQPGATFSATATGPTEDPDPSGVLTPQPVTGTLDANGRAQLQVRINRLGTYQNTVTVTVGSITRTATQTITVTPAPNTCPALPSSIRFKRGVVALLPDDVRPLGLNPVAFRYVEPWGDPSVPRIGLIAEEVAEVFPEAVLLDGQGRPEAILYRVLTASVVEAMEARAAEAVKTSIARLAERF